MVSEKRAVSESSDQSPSKRLQTSTWLITDSFGNTITISIPVSYDNLEVVESFTVHQTLICKHSEYVRNAIQKDSCYRKTSISLTTGLASHFKIYAEWLYSQRTDITALVRGTYEPAADCEETREHFIGHTLCNLWITGGVLGDSKFKNQIMDNLELFDFYSKEKAKPDTVRLIVEKTRSDSKLSVWLAHHLFGMSSFEFHFIKENLHEDKLKLILDQYIRDTARPSPLQNFYMERVSKRCQYHEHVAEEPECPPFED